jgi:hypothetical protein
MCLHGLTGLVRAVGVAGLAPPAVTLPLPRETYGSSSTGRPRMFCANWCVWNSLSLAVLIVAKEGISRPS